MSIIVRPSMPRAFAPTPDIATHDHVRLTNFTSAVASAEPGRVEHTNATEYRTSDVAADRRT